MFGRSKALRQELVGAATAEETAAAATDGSAASTAASLNISG